MIQTSNWRSILIYQALFSTLTVVIVLVLGGSQQAASAATGALLTTGNLGLLAWTWTRLFDKKSIAWAGAIIVTKYAILVGILYWILQQRWIQGMWFMAGVVTFVPTMFLIGWRSNDDLGKGD